MASAVLVRKRVGWSEGGVVNYEGTRLELQGEAKRPPSGLVKTRPTIGRDRDAAVGRDGDIPLSGTNARPNYVGKRHR